MCLLRDSWRATLSELGAPRPSHIVPLGANPARRYRNSTRMTLFTKLHSAGHRVRLLEFALRFQARKRVSVPRFGTRHASLLHLAKFV
jgi:hypothetical protein